MLPTRRRSGAWTKPRRPSAPSSERRCSGRRSMDELIARQASKIAARAERELEALVAISSPSGDLDGAEEAVALCAALLPTEFETERVPCSTEGSAPDFIARLG